MPLTLTRQMADEGPLWRNLAERRSLIEADLASLVSWGFGDFIFDTETDVISVVNKIYAHGFHERLDSTLSLLGAIDQLKTSRVLP